MGVRLTGHLGCAFALGFAGVEKCFVAFAVGRRGRRDLFRKILPETWVFVFKFHGMISFHIPAAGLAINDKTWYNQYSMKRDRMTAPVHRGRVDNIEENDQSRDGHHRFLHGGHLMMIAVSGRSALAFVFAVIFVGMGVYFLRYFERQRVSTI